MEKLSVKINPKTALAFGYIRRFFSPSRFSLALNTR